MNVILLLRSLGIGGTERQAVELAIALSKRGHRTTIMTFYSKGELSRDTQTAGVELIEIHKQSRWDIFAFPIRLATRIRERQPDFLYSFGTIPNLFAVVIRPLIRPCRIAWGIRNSMIFPAAPGWLGRIISAMTPRLSFFADLTISNSLAGRNEALRRGFRARSLHIVENGINTCKFTPSEDARIACRNELGVESDELLVGTVGHISARKGSADFLQAAAYLASKDRKLKFLIVGDDGGCMAGLPMLIESLGIADKTICLSARTNIVPIYNAIDALCSASHGEGFPNVIAEAMACGKPCVVTNVGESAAIVGSHGIIVPPGQPDALADGLAKVVGALGQYGDPDEIRRRIQERFSTDTLAERVEQLLSPSVD